MAQSQSSAASLISRRHPRYGELEPEWSFFMESYLGGQAYFGKHLFQYFKEGNREFAARKARAYRENHTKRVVDLVNSYLFQEEPLRKVENERVSAFLENFDGRGRRVDIFMKKASLLASIFGRIYIICDRKPIAPEKRTGTQRDNLDPAARPYCYTVYPQDMLDLSFDGQGNIRWALVREMERDDEDPFLGTGDMKERYRLWFPDGWRLFNDHAEEIDSGETRLGRVPIVILDNEEQDEYSGLSLVSDVACLDRAIMNNWSRLDVIVNDQTFSQLIFPIEGLPAEIVENEKLREQFLTLATNRVVLYSAAAQATPQYIAPDASQADFILRMIVQQVKQLYASIGLQSETAVEQKQESSGVSKAFDFQKLNKLLAGKADNLEQAEREIIEIFKHWVGVTAEVEIDYPETFDVKSLADEISMAQELTLLGISETFTKELHKTVVAKVMPKADRKVIDQINSEIDARNASEEEAAKAGNFDFDKKARGQEE